MPFRKPLASQHSSPTPCPPRSPLSPAISSLAAPSSPSSRAATPTPAGTLRLPAPPPPPKPLHLTMSTRGRHHREDNGKSRGGYPAMPRWSSVNRSEDGSDEEDGEGTVKLGGGARGYADDEDEEKQALEGLAKLFAPSASDAAIGDEPPFSTSERGSGRRARTDSSEASTAYGSAKDTLSSRGGGRSTIRGTPQRRSIYFDATKENPLIPPSTPSTLDADASTTKQAGRDDSGDDRGFSDAATANSDDNLSHPSVSASSSTSLLDLPPFPSPAISVHSFAGEPAFGELSFDKGVPLCIEVEDLGGGWSLGFIAGEGEKGRGLVPRGWYAYVDMPESEMTPSPASPTSTTTLRPISPSTSTSSADPPPSHSELEKQPSPNASFRAPSATASRPSPPTSAVLTASAPPEPSHSSLNPSTHDEPRLSSSLLVPCSADAEHAEPYATRSIGRHVVVSGIEFEPADWLSTPEGEEEPLIAELLGAEQPAVVVGDGEHSVVVGAAEPLVEAAVGARTAGDGEEPETKELLETDAPASVCDEEPIEEVEPFASTEEGGELESPSGVAEVVDEALPYMSSDVGATTTSPSEANDDLPNLPSLPLAASSLPSTHPSAEPASSFFHLGLGSISASSPSQTYVLGGLSVPGASILAASHSQLSTPKKARLERKSATMADKGFVLEWIRKGDELDEEIGEETQVWEVESGPAWKSASELPFIVHVHSPEKVSPLGASPYTTFQLTTIFPSSPSSLDSSSASSSHDPLAVTRRFSHFVALHALLVANFPVLAIPQLPPKAFGAKRFGEEFVEQRRRDLERWVNRVGRHPVLRESEEVRGFLCLDDEKDLRTLLAASALPSPLFFARTFHPEFNVDLHSAAELGERFEKHVKALELGEGVKDVEGAVKSHREGVRGSANNLQTLAHCLVRLIAGVALPPPSYDTTLHIDSDSELTTTESDAARAIRRAEEWCVQNVQGAMSWKDQDEEALGLAKAVQATAEAIASIADLEDDSARNALLAVHELLREGAHPASQHATLLSTHKQVLAEYRRLGRLSESDHPDVQDQISRCETVLNITCSEMERVRVERNEDLKSALELWLDAQITMQEQSLEQLRFARDHFSAEAFPALALTGPRLASHLGTRPDALVYPALPQPSAYGTSQSVLPAAASVVSGAVGSVLGRSSSRTASGTTAYGARSPASSPTLVRSMAAKAGLQFPVSRVRKYLKAGRYAQRIGQGAPVYLAAVLEYLVAELLELAGNAARDNKKKRIIPRHIQLAVRNDEELNRLLAHVEISQGGVLPHIHAELLPAASKKKVAVRNDNQDDD
ncbi:hypothetical protein JCM1840_006657 [Sporobolomyces johnsonii]